MELTVIARFRYPRHTTTSFECFDKTTLAAIIISANETDGMTADKTRKTLSQYFGKNAVCQSATTNVQTSVTFRLKISLFLSCFIWCTTL